MDNIIQMVFTGNVDNLQRIKGIIRDYIDDCMYFNIDLEWDYFLKFKYIPVNIYYCTKNIWIKKFKEIKINIRNNC